MENKYLYSKVIIIGSGQLAYKCAKETKKYLENVRTYELKLTESTILEKMCLRDNIFYENINKEKLTEYLLLEQETTLIISAGSTYIVPRNVIQKDNLSIINWHNALLPYHKGRNAEAWSIYEGDEMTGVTWHYIVEAVDEGAIIAQCQIKIDKKVTSLSLLKKQYDCGYAVFQDILPDLLQKEVKAVNQLQWIDKIKHLFDQTSEKLHYSYEVPNQGYFDCTWRFEKASCFLRSMDYGSLYLMGKMYVIYKNEQYSFYKYRIEEINIPEHEPGTILMNEEFDLIIYYGENRITLKNLKKGE